MKTQSKFQNSKSIVKLLMAASCGVLLGLATTSVTVTTADEAGTLAKPVEQFHNHFTDSFSDEVCDIPVDIDIVITENIFLYEDDSFKNTSSMMATYTNPVNGKSVKVSSAGQVTGSAIVDEEAGTITFLTTYKGLPEQILDAGNRGVLLRDAGIITFVTTYDLETEELISEEITVNKGPHPDAESDFTLFCEVFSGALE
jgi:hypothetical protein